MPDSFRLALIGGGPVPAPLLARARAARLLALQTYGLTEACSQVTTERPTEADGRTAGAALPGLEVRIVGLEGAVLGPGREGDIEVRGPTRMDGYLGEPALAPGAWFRTGDLGTIDEEGHLHVLGREDDRIVTGGENVDPLAVEEALGMHPAVEAACVVGIHDPEWGERVCAYVVSRDPTPPAIASLRAHLADRVASFALSWVN